MLGAEIDASVDVTAQDVLEAHRSRLKDAAVRVGVVVRRYSTRASPRPRTRRADGG